MNLVVSDWNQRSQYKLVVYTHIQVCVRMCELVNIHLFPSLEQLEAVTPQQ